MSIGAKLSLAALFFALSLLLFWNANRDWRSRFAGQDVFRSFAPDSVVAMELSGRGGGVKLARVSGRWVVPALSDHPADFVKVARTVKALSALKSARVLDGLSEREFKDLGLDQANPGGPSISLFGASGKLLASLQLGAAHFRGGGLTPSSRQETPSGRYCLAVGPDGSRTAFLSTSLFDWCEAEPGVWLEAPEIDVSKALKLSVRSSKHGSWSIFRRTLKEPFVFGPPRKGAPAPKILGEMLSLLAKPRITGLASKDAVPELEESLSLALELEGGSVVEYDFEVSGAKAALKLKGPGLPAFPYSCEAKYAKSFAMPPPPLENP
jgi:hypothetical protein